MAATRLRGVATYGHRYKLTYLRGPSGLVVMLAEELTKVRRENAALRRQLTVDIDRGPGSRNGDLKALYSGKPSSMHRMLFSLS